MIKYMVSGRDRILVVENDPVVADLIGRQALQVVGYQVGLVGDANSAIARAIQWIPDVMLVDVNLSGLSGKDLLVALKSQGMQTPVILLAQRGQEADIIQSFRLGAADYLLLPVREAEVVAVVERVLKQVHERQERERLAQQLQTTNQELQLRVRELTTLFAVGKAVTSTIDLSTLLRKILAGAVSVTQADLGWFLMRDDAQKPFTLVAERNLPASLGLRVGQAWDDGVSKLVAMSGEALAIHGEPLKRFKISLLGRSAVIAPIRALQRNQPTVIGLLAMMRRQAVAFTTSEQHLLEALADYASIALVNANVIHSAEERARSLQAAVDTARLAEEVNAGRLQVLRSQVDGSLAAASAELAQAGGGSERSGLQQTLGALRRLAQETAPVTLDDPLKLAPLDLREALRQAVARAQTRLQHVGLRLESQAPGDSVMVLGEPALVGLVLDGLFGEALRRCSRGGQLSLRLEKTSSQHAQLALCLKGVHWSAAEARQSKEAPGRVARKGHPAGQDAGLGLAGEIIPRLGGSLWVDDPPDQGVTLSIRIPLAD
jgi:DNA-binding response OmpR family regulator